MKATQTLTQTARKETRVSELEILRAEYKRAQEHPLFDDPAQYSILLDLILDKIEQLEGTE